MARAVLITGAAQRIGKAIAHTFAAADYKVALHYHRSQVRAQELADSLAVDTCCLRADLATLTLAGGETLLHTAAQELGTEITCLINNASIFERDFADDINETLMESHLAINLKAPLFLSQALVKQNEANEAKTPRHILMLLDQKVLNPTPHFFSYSLSKMALWSSTQMLARAYAPWVRVNAVAPGPILPSKHQTQAEFDHSVKQTPLARNAQPEDVAAACLFLEQQASITGEILTLDGGQHLASHV